MKLGQHVHVDDGRYYADGAVEAFQNHPTQGAMVKVAGDWWKIDDVIDDQPRSHGQRWEPCPRCGDEPVCNDCGYCETHCTCAQDAEDRRQVREIERAEPGFFRKLAEHLEQGAQER